MDLLREIKNVIYVTFASGDVKWILADENTGLINDILGERYEIL